MTQIEQRHRTTVAMRRDQLLGLVAESAAPEVAEEIEIDRVLAHTVPRDRLSAASIENEIERDSESVSPLAVFGVLGLLLTLFVALTRLG